MAGAARNGLLRIESRTLPAKPAAELGRGLARETSRFPRAYRPVKLGGRFSRNAVTPSAKSVVFVAAVWS